MYYCKNIEFVLKNVNNIIMLKTIKLITLFIFTFVSIVLSVYGEENSDIKLREGAFVKVLVLEEFSTLTSDIDDEVKFINLSDIYVYDTNIIPENSIFYGKIEDLKEPVTGKDGALKILINKIVTPDEKVYNVTAHIYNENDNYLGGRNTAPVYYRKVPHYIKGFRPILQLAPLNVYEMGKHTIIKPGAELLVIFDKDMIVN